MYHSPNITWRPPLRPFCAKQVFLCDVTRALPGPDSAPDYKGGGGVRRLGPCSIGPRGLLFSADFFLVKWGLIVKLIVLVKVGSNSRPNRYPPPELRYYLKSYEYMTNSCREYPRVTLSCNDVGSLAEDYLLWPTHSSAGPVIYVCD